MTGELRASFVGRASEVGHAVPAAAVPGLHASFVEHRAGQASSRVLAHIAEHDPHVVVVFGVRTLPAATVRAIGVPVLAWETCPDRPPGLEHHPDLPDADVRHRAGLARAADYAQVIDRPLPVADEHFVTPRPTRREPRALVVGHSSPRLESVLVDSKHRHEVLHVAAGLRGAALAGVLSGADVAIDLRDDDRPGFGPRVALYLAAGLLLISEPLHPPSGLQAGVDHLEIRSSAELVELLARVRADPGAFDEIRAQGRRSAEAFRASRVLAELLGPYRSSAIRGAARSKTR